MTVATITPSSKGQVIIPKEIRDELRWEPGAQLTVISTPSGITIKAAPKKATRNLDLGLAVTADVGALVLIGCHHWSSRPPLGD